MEASKNNIFGYFHSTKELKMWMQRHFTDTPILWEPEENAGKFFKRFQKIVEEKEGIQFGKFHFSVLFSILILINR
ncbi:hypothetical protein JTE90_009665 [Oedothorax gibbosus]|uniref:Uncharacterized protein n=1 Tax=Oedothorax gibbosus TaxID=931172 RepID=A0AAV6TPT3_9ARAC|nr:hypothetical protein JTE90_009665 [Oedothorax gibbosus]